MFKVNIVKNGIITNSGLFDNQELADAWISQEVSKSSWGKPARTISELDAVIEFGIDIVSNMDDYETHELNGEDIRFYHIPAEFTIEKINLGIAPLMEIIRTTRNKLLSDCDWTQLADSTLSVEAKVAWATYRQALRDLPEELEDPNEVVWPEFPL